MPYLKTPNVALISTADWTSYRKTVPNCSPAEARRIAMLDPTIRFFFYCRDHMTLENPNWPAPRIFQPKDAVFFSGDPWWGSAPQCDGYIKDGLSVAYVGNFKQSDPTSPMAAAGYSTAQGLNAVDVVSFFAGNIALAASGDLVRLAPEVPVAQGDFLAVAHDFYGDIFRATVGPLQDRGIAVLLTLLNNYDAAGWSNFDPTTNQGQNNAWNFALQMSNIVDNYGFDGIDVDDEWAKPDLGIQSSLAMVTSMMRQLMPDKIISKALFEDSAYFAPGATYQGVGLAQTLTYGWQMSYGPPPQYVLPDYVDYGMSKQALVMGYWAHQPSSDPSGDVQWLKSNGYAGVMAYAFEEQANQDLLGSLVDDWMGPGNWNKG